MARLRELNEAPDADVRAILLRACGSTRWVDRMMARRPFANDARLLFAARNEWFGLTEADWLEAFAHHPRIGDRARAAAQSPEAHKWSSQEQSAAADASTDTLADLAEGNRAYEGRFGYVFLISATGRTSEEMLATLRERMRNEPETELTIASGEQAKITRLRLMKLLEELA